MGGKIKIKGGTEDYDNEDDPDFTNDGSDRTKKNKWSRNKLFEDYDTKEGLEYLTGNKVDSYDSIKGRKFD